MVRERERKIVRRRLDAEMRPYRRAAMETNPTDGLLSVVRQVLRIPVMEIASKIGVERSVLYGLETSERRKTITLKSLNRVAKAMGCRVVYGVVPEGGLTFEELAEERQWAMEQGIRQGTREQGNEGPREQGSEGAGERGSGGARERGNEGTVNRE
jgi:transcriptional regulator with XRE-family HTH domain